MIRGEIGFEPINTHEYTKDWTQNVWAWSVLGLVGMDFNNGLTRA